MSTLALSVSAPSACARNTHRGPTCRLEIGDDGVYWFRTERPGNEFVSGWGPDDEPHIHWEVDCNGCAPSGAFGGDAVRRWNKVYLGDVCTLSGCGNAGSAHQAALTAGVYTYDVVL